MKRVVRVITSNGVLSRRMQSRVDMLEHVGYEIDIVSLSTDPEPTQERLAYWFDECEHMTIVA